MRRASGTNHTLISEYVAGVTRRWLDQGVLVWVGCGASSCGLCRVGHGTYSGGTSVAAASVVPARARPSFSFPPTSSSTWLCSGSGCGSFALDTSCKMASWGRVIPQAAAHSIAAPSHTTSQLTSMQPMSLMPLIRHPGSAALVGSGCCCRCCYFCCSLGRPGATDLAAAGLGSLLPVTGPARNFAAAAKSPKKRRGGPGEVNPAPEPAEEKPPPRRRKVSEDEPAPEPAERKAAAGSRRRPKVREEESSREVESTEACRRQEKGSKGKVASAGQAGGPVGQRSEGAEAPAAVEEGQPGKRRAGKETASGVGGGGAAALNSNSTPSALQAGSIVGGHAPSVTAPALAGLAHATEGTAAASVSAAGAAAAAAAAPGPTAAATFPGGPVGGASRPWHAGLNEEQLAAVRDRSAAVLYVTAGPGSGKTRTLVARVAELVQHHGVPPRCIAVVTFTRKAADELSSRLREALGPQAAEAVVTGTFHSLSARLLRSYFQLADRTADPDSRLSWMRKDFRVMEDEEHERTLVGALREAEAALGAPSDTRRVRRFKELVSYIKNRTETTHGLTRDQLLRTLRALALHHAELKALIDGHERAYGNTIEATAAAATAAPAPAIPTPGIPPLVPPPAATAPTVPSPGAATTYFARQPGSNGGGGSSDLLLFLATLERYDGRLKAAGCLDYDDLMGLAVALMSQPGPRRAMARGIRHILVDEFQDTNVPQYSLVRLLQSEGTEVFMVGDSDQAIYTWRGALPSAMREGVYGNSPAGGGGGGGDAELLMGSPPPDDGVPAAAAGGCHDAGPADAGTAVLAAVNGVNESGGGGGPSGQVVVKASVAERVAAAQAPYGVGTSPGPGSGPAAAGGGAAAAAGPGLGGRVATLYLRRNHRSLPHIVAVAEHIINQQPHPHPHPGQHPHPHPHDSRGSTQPQSPLAPTRVQPSAAFGLYGGSGSGGALGSEGGRTVLQAVRPARPGAAVAVVTCGTGRDEAAWVAAQIQRIVADSGGATKLHDIAVLYRLNRQARVFEEALQAAEVPYCLPKSTPFWAGDQVRDVVSFLRLAAAPLEASGQLIAATLSRPGRGIDPSSAVLSRLKRPTTTALRGTSPGRLLFGDMVVPGGDQPGEPALWLRLSHVVGSASATGKMTARQGAGGCKAAGSGAGGDWSLVDPARPPPALAQMVEDVLGVLLPPPPGHEDTFPPAQRARGRQQGAWAGGGAGAGGGGSSGDRWLPLPAEAIRRQLPFPDLAPSDPPWMLVVDNEAFPAPLAPPPPEELCQQLNLQPGDAEYDGIVFLRDLVVLLHVAAATGWEPHDIIDIIVRATGYETWLELEQGDRKDLSEELNQLAGLRSAAQQFLWSPNREIIGEDTATSRVSARDEAGAHNAPTEEAHPASLSELAGGFARLVDSAEAARRRSGRGVGPGDDAASAPPDCVRLLTLHASKGLEFPVVFVTGCEEGLLPYKGAEADTAQWREEQRLLFVGATRAMDQLYLTWAASRAHNRQRERVDSRERAESEAAAATASAGSRVRSATAPAAGVAICAKAGGSSSRRMVKKADRMSYMSTFISQLLKDLHAEGRLVEAAPDTSGCISGWADPGRLGGAPSGSESGSAPGPAPLVMYYNTTTMRAYSLGTLLPGAVDVRTDARVLLRFGSAAARGGAPQGGVYARMDTTDSARRSGGIGSSGGSRGSGSSGGSRGSGSRGSGSKAAGAARVGGKAGRGDRALMAGG